MVMKLGTWYVYEPGDEVYSLQHSRSGLVVGILSLNLSDQTQQVAVRLRGTNQIVEVDTSLLELRYRTANSIFSKPSPKPASADA